MYPMTGVKLVTCNRYINRHLGFDSILAGCQHGSQCQRSCEIQLVEDVQEIISNLDGAVNRGNKQTNIDHNGF